MDASLTVLFLILYISAITGISVSGLVSSKSEPLSISNFIILKSLLGVCKVQIKEIYLLYFYDKY